MLWNSRLRVALGPAGTGEGLATECTFMSDFSSGILILDPGRGDPRRKQSAKQGRCNISTNPVVDMGDKPTEIKAMNGLNNVIA